MGFRLVLTSVTLNDPERHNRYFIEFDSFARWLCQSGWRRI